jgi:hypothetical protein
MNIPDDGVVRPTTVRWRILGWIVLASVVTDVLRFNLSVGGPAIKRDLGVRFGLRPDLSLQSRAIGFSSALKPVIEAA